MTRLRNLTRSLPLKRRTTDGSIFPRLPRHTELVSRMGTLVIASTGYWRVGNANSASLSTVIRTEGEAVLRSRLLMCAALTYKLHNMVMPLRGSVTYDPIA